MSNSNYDSNYDSNSGILSQSEITSGNNKPIDIIDLISQLDNLGKEKDKYNFIANYAVIKEKIEQVDNILDNNDDNPDQIFDTYSIQELFNILESNYDLVSEPTKLDIVKFKMLLKISKILEDKLRNETMSIIELK